MNFRMLLRGEWFKASRRMAFVAVTILVAGVSAIMNGASWYQGRDNPAKAFAFPHAWAAIVGEPAQMSVFFVIVLIILLVASEFTWRTARQNVIDGLSKDEWFVSKVLLTITLCLFYMLILLAVGVPFAALSSSDTFIRGMDVKMLLSSTVGMIGFASLAFMLAMLMRNAGTALGVFLLIVSMVESLITILVFKFHKAWLPMTRYLPIKLFGAMVEPNRWNPEALHVTAAMRQSSLDAGTPPNMAQISAVAVLYIFVLFGIAYWNYRERDL